MNNRYRSEVGVSGEMITAAGNGPLSEAHPLVLKRSVTPDVVVSVTIMLLASLKALTLDCKDCSLDSLVLMNQSRSSGNELRPARNTSRAAPGALQQLAKWLVTFIAEK